MDGQTKVGSTAVTEPLPRGGFVRAVTESISDALVALDCGGELMYVNRAAEHLLGWRQDELAGTVFHEVVDYRCAGGRPLHPGSLAQRAGEVVRFDGHRVTRRDGSEVALQVTAAPFDTLGGRGQVLVLRDAGSSRALPDGGQAIEPLSRPDLVRDALEEDRFVLHAQPIVEVATGSTVNHELLIRMVDHDGELVLPGDFLPAAEQSGLIVEIDRWVAKQAVALASRGQPVQLNLSALSLAARPLIDDVRAELIRQAADPSLIVIELTETALAAGEHTAELFIEHVQTLGCKLALDDFGSGYGGFSYLKRLPVDYLKIDMEFVRDLSSNQGSRRIVEAVVALADGFGQKTVAEGVEATATLQILRELGVDYAQGYAIGRPAPADEVFADARSQAR